MTGSPLAQPPRDRYRYFRVEARELTDALATGLGQLRDPANDPEPVVQALLRHAHTLKGAARVVDEAGIADEAHALEELLGPYREGGRQAAAVVEDGLDLVDRMVHLVDALGSPAAETPSAATGPEVPETAEPVVERVTVRADLVDVDEVIRTAGRGGDQVTVLRSVEARLAGLRDLPGAGPDLLAGLAAVRRIVSGAADRMERDLRQIHDGAQRLRLVAVSAIAPDLERAARDVAGAQGKRVAVDVVGGRVRLDAPLLSVVQPALQQMVRNAVAHGIETPDQRLAAGKPVEGRIRVEVTLDGARARFRCRDDGRGVDLDAVRNALAGKGIAVPSGASSAQLLDLLLRAGVSTAERVTEVSGRGIGLDVVREAADRLGGRAHLSTDPGRGTTVELVTPLSLTARDLVVVDAGQPVGVPLDAVRQVARVPAADVVEGPNGATWMCEDEPLPFLSLSAALATAAGVAAPTRREAPPAWSVLVMEAPGTEGFPGARVAAAVPRLLGTAEPAVRPLPLLTPATALVAGVWLDGDTPRLVLDPAAVVAAATRRGPTPAVPAPRAPVLVIDDSLTTRMLEQSILESAGYRVEVASSAEEGLARASRTRYSVVLCDVEMPGMDGFGFLEQVRSRPELRDLPCILVTSRASAADRQRGLDAGADAHIDKGQFHQGVLLETIHRLLEAS
ncbi:response regulator [Spongisporangium articulatum]|uniref:histidine kinase n=1 Tax=Spongisporangium articulatum TaxID=3362603 RepID=A0ABW8AKM9_9ACTN